MGRQGPRLVPFLHKGVLNKKYRNLISEDTSDLVFSIVLPHKTKKLELEDELIFMDWYALNGKKYVPHSKHYTDAKQAITASLRKSDYVEKVHISDNKLTYRILSKAEVKEKKGLKKELKKLKEVKKEATDSDDALSAVESGYGSGVDSPQNDNAPVLLDEKSIPLCDIETLPLFNAMDVGSILEINNLLPNTSFTKLDEFLKTESIDASISTENQFAVPDVPIFFEVDSFANTQMFSDNLKSADSFPSNEHSTYRLDLMDCSTESPELNSSGFEESFPFENVYDLSDEDLKLLLEDSPTFDSNPFSENNINQASETQDGHQMHTDESTKGLLELLGDISANDVHSSVAIEGKGQEPISSDLGASLPVYKTEAENIYLCKKCVHLGKTPILLCEPQFQKSSETSGEFKIAFEEAVWNDISGFKSVKEYKFINDHLLVILEPNDE